MRDFGVQSMKGSGCGWLLLFCHFKKEAQLSSSPAFTKGMSPMKGVVGNADFPQLMLAESSPSLAAAAKAGGVPGENYSLITSFTET